MLEKNTSSAIEDTLDPRTKPGTVPQKRSNSIPIATVSLSERMSVLRNTNSPSMASAKDIPHQLSPSSSPSSKKLNRSLSDSSDSSLSSSSLETFATNKTAKLHKLLKSLSLTTMAENELKFRISPTLEMDSSDSYIPQLSLDSFSSKFKEGKYLIPKEFIEPGIELLRITQRKKVKRCFQIDTQKNILRWNNKASSFLRIDKIKNIRAGDDACNYREEFKISSEYKDLWITIIYSNDSISNNIKALHVLATSKYDFDIFANTLRLLVFVNRDLAKNISLGSDDDLFTNFHWNNYVMNESEFNEQIVETPRTKISNTLNFEGVLKLAKRLNINVDPGYLSTLFKLCDIDSNGYLDFEEFKTFVTLLRTRQEIHTIFNEAVAGADQMTYDQFSSFLIDVQAEQFDQETVYKAFSKFSGDGSHLTVEEFQNFLKSSYTSPFLHIEENYSRPLNEYYISSSHNTYLLGRQFGGDSSAEGYIRVLQRGCRCIEIDLWDGQLENGDKGPIVKHGRSFTSSVSLQVVLQAIRKYAFITTPYPLIISLEIHCNFENQLIIKSLLTEILGDMLVLEPLMTNSFQLPSPESLKHKVLIKVKKSSSSSASGSFSDSTGNSSTTNTTTSSFSEDALSRPSKKSLISRPQISTKMNSELSALGVYLSALKFRNFSLPESKSFNHCFSFSEKTINKMLKEPVKHQSILKHNVRYLMRLYPSKYRYKSTNFNPIAYWALGIQMVATNWQMFDLGQQLNESMFLVGSNTGYVLKPEKLRNIVRSGDKADDALQRVNLSFQVISGQQLPCSKGHENTVNTFVQFEIYGRQTLSALDGIERTKVVKANGFNPIWNETFSRTFVTLDTSLIFIRLLVKCVTETAPNDETVVGVCVLKLNTLKKGYRHLTVYDLQGEEFIFSKLFVKIDYEFSDV